MKRIITTSIFGLALAIALGFGLVPRTEQTASCADCDTDNLGDIQKVFKGFNEECIAALKKAGETVGASVEPKRCYALGIYGKILPVLKKLAKDNRFGPGDRILFPGEGQNGNLVAGANRTFTAGSPSPTDKMQIDITHVDGKNGALIKICAVDEKGNVTRPAANIKFEEDEGPGTKTVTATGIQGKIVRVQVASFGGALKNFKYVLVTKQQ